MLPTTFLAFALASAQTVAALPSAETPSAVADVRLVINGVVQDAESVTARAMSNSPISAFLGNEQCSGNPDYTWNVGADGECFSFVDQQGNHRDMGSVQVDPKHCTSFVYHGNYNCKGNNWYGPGPANGCNSFGNKGAIKSFSIRCF